MPQSQPLVSDRDIRVTARATLNTLASLGFEACLFGSAACALYGMRSRTPHDVDVIVLTNRDAEDIKSLLVSSNRKFYLVSSRKPHEHYHVLWFSVRSRNRLIYDEHENAFLVLLKSDCKVDILTPGTLSIPNIPIQSITTLRGPEKYDEEDEAKKGVVFLGYFYPLVPLLALILLKLRGWTDRQVDPRPHIREKTRADKSDIDEMLKLAVEKYGAWLGRRRERWMPEWFVEEGKKRVGLYATAFPESLWYWRQLGFFRHLGGHIRLSEIEIVEDRGEADHVEIVVISDPE